LFEYFDALNAPPSGKMNDASPHERKNIHIYMVDENADIFSEMNAWNLKPPKDNLRPLMLYLDTDAINVSMSSIDRWLMDRSIVVIVHDSSGGLRGQMNELNKDLNLYYKISVEDAGDGKA
jgi:hypothetical protein